MGGKTGTAQKLPRGQGNYLVSFIGFAPVDNPQLLVEDTVFFNKVPLSSCMTFPFSSVIFFTTCG